MVARRRGAATPAAARRGRGHARRRYARLVVETLEAASVLFAKNPLPMWVYDSETLAVLDVNEAAVASYGWSREEFLSKSILELRPDGPDGTPPPGRPDSGVETHLRRDGSRLEAELRSSRIEIGGRPAVLLVAEDATRRLAAARELQALVTRALNLREEEQTRIAREIHDSLGQSLTVLKFDLTLLADGLKKRGALAEKAREMARRVDAAIASLRDIAAGLHPATLEQLGLAATLEWTLERFQKDTGLPCSLDASGLSVPIPPELAVALYRIVQEALSNVLRHAQARRVEVSLSSDEGGICLRVTDDGKGISPDDTLKPRSLGLIGMRERARALGGTLKVEGAPGFGTRVEVRAPATLPGEEGATS
jgi:PAS domain S-box-containing protein